MLSFIAFHISYLIYRRYAPVQVASCNINKVETMRRNVFSISFRTFLFSRNTGKLLFPVTGILGLELVLQLVESVMMINLLGNELTRFFPSLCRCVSLDLRASHG